MATATVHGERVVVTLIVTCLAGTFTAVVLTLMPRPNQTPATPPAAPNAVTSGATQPVEISVATPTPTPLPPPAVAPVEPEVIEVDVTETLRRKHESAQAQLRAALNRSEAGAVVASSWMRWRERAQALAEQALRVARMSEQQRVRKQEAEFQQRVSAESTELQTLAWERDQLIRQVKTTRDQWMEARQRPQYAVVPYQGNQGTAQVPIVLDCHAAGVTLRPNGPSFDKDDLKLAEGFRSNPFLSTVRTRARAIERGDDPNSHKSGSGITPAATPYLLFLVRSSGINSYYDARECLRPLEIAFGYELVDDDWAVNAPGPAPGPEELPRESAPTPWRNATVTQRTASPSSTVKASASPPALSLEPTPDPPVFGARPYRTRAESESESGNESEIASRGASAAPAARAEAWRNDTGLSPERAEALERSLEHARSYVNANRNANDADADSARVLPTPSSPVIGQSDAVVRGPRSRGNGNGSRVTVSATGSRLPAGGAFGQGRSGDLARDVSNIGTPGGGAGIGTGAGTGSGTGSGMGTGTGAGSGTDGETGEGGLPDPRPTEALEIVLVCSQRGLTIHPGGVRLSREVLSNETENEKNRWSDHVQRFVNINQLTRPGIRLLPYIRFLVEPGGDATYWQVLGQARMQGLNWPMRLQIAEPERLRFFAPEAW